MKVILIQNIQHLLLGLEISIINESAIDDVFESIYGTIITNIQKSFGKGWGLDY